MSKPTPNPETSEMVGLEPTAEMLEAGMGEFGWSDDAEDECRRIYIAMHAVALDAAEQRASSDVKVKGLDAAMSRVMQIAPRRAPEVLRSALSTLSKKYHWHMMWPKPEQMAELASEIDASLSALQIGGGDA